MADLLTGLPGHCDWCLSFSGLTKKGRACCELRMLAGRPKGQRQDEYEKVRRSDGDAAVKLLSSAVMAENQRKVAFNAEKRALAHQKI